MVAVERLRSVWCTSGHTLRGAAGALCFVLLGASLLATSEVPPPTTTLSSQLEGPGVELDNQRTAMSYRVVARAAALAETGALTTENPTLSVHFQAEHFGWQAADTGASGAPWVTVAVVNADGRTLIESPAFLTAFESATTLAFTGDCEEPDAEGPEPCQTAFTVTFERAATQNAAASTTVTWSLEFLSTIPGKAKPDAGTELPWQIDVTEL